MSGKKKLKYKKIQGDGDNEDVGTTSEASESIPDPPCSTNVADANDPNSKNFGQPTGLPVAGALDSYLEARRPSISIENDASLMVPSSTAASDAVAASTTEAAPSGDGSAMKIAKDIDQRTDVIASTATSAQSDRSHKSTAQMTMSNPSWPHLNVLKHHEQQEQLDQMTYATDQFRQQQLPAPQHWRQDWGEGTTGIPLQPRLSDMDGDDDGRSMLPIPMFCRSQSTPLQQRPFTSLISNSGGAFSGSGAGDGNGGFGFGDLGVDTSGRSVRSTRSDGNSIGRSLFPRNEPNDVMNDGDGGGVAPSPRTHIMLTRTFSTPEYWRPLRSYCSAFSQPSCSRSDPGIPRISRSAFMPVASSKSLTESLSSEVLGSVEEGGGEAGRSDVAEADNGSGVGGGRASKESTPEKLKASLRGSKLFSKLKSVRRKKRRSRSGRENPARPHLSGDEMGDSPDFMKAMKDSPLLNPEPLELPPAADLSALTISSSKDDQEVDPLKQLIQADQGGEAGVALSCSSSSEDEDDGTNEPIVGQYHLLDHEDDHPCPSPSVEVTFDALRPPSIEVESPACNQSNLVGGGDSPIHTSSPEYHPLVDESDDVDGDRKDTNTEPSSENVTPSRLETPNNHSSPASHDSRVSSSNSRFTATSGSNNTSQTEASLGDADMEVREANRRHDSRREEVVVDLDGNATVFSSSTSSSNFHAYINSPRPLREGATMPVDRFFAGGNISLSPKISEVAFDSGEAEVNISKFLSLSPKKINRSHSPHTVSSASVSNGSSSGSEPKKPLKFVAYEVEERDSPAQIVDCSGIKIQDVSSRDTGHRTALIQPRISKGSDRRHGFQHQRPPLSPEKSDWNRNYLSGTRTPTRTPPPSQYRETLSGANTPCSPPVIVDGPDVLRSDYGRSGAKKPHVVRSSKGKIFLIPPSSAGYHATGTRHQMQPQQPVTLSSPIENSMTVLVAGSANDGAQEVFTAHVPAVSPDSRGKHNTSLGKNNNFDLFSSQSSIPETNAISDSNDKKDSKPAEVKKKVPTYSEITRKPAKHNATTKQHVPGPAIVSPEKGI